MGDTQTEFVALCALNRNMRQTQARQRSRPGHAFGFVDSGRTPRHLAPLFLWLVAFSAENRYPPRIKSEAGFFRKMPRSPIEWM
jgi:hypothetical protein